MKKQISTFLIILLYLCSSNLIYSQTPGSLDLSFNGKGYIETDFSITSRVYGIAVQSDGKIVACGSSYFNGYNIAMARYNSDGSPDTDFGQSGTGHFSHVFGASDEFVTDVVLQPDGKILISGYTNTSGSYLSNSFVARFNEDGSFDNTFSSDGIQIINVSDFDNANSIFLQEDGKILVYGTSNSGSGSNNLCVSRLLENGQIDLSFGSSGTTIIDVDDESHDYGEGIGVSNGNIYLAGLSYSDTDNIVVLKLDSSGHLDNSFGDNGVTSFEMDLYNIIMTNGTDLIITQDNKIAVSAFQCAGTDVDFVVVKVLMNGFPDEDFGIHGVVVTDMIGDNKPFSIIEQPNGDLLLGGYHKDIVNDKDFTIARYLDNGDLDATFGNHYGVTWNNLSSNISNPVDIIYSMAMQEDGKIVAAGYSMGPDHPNFTVARYYSGLEVGIESNKTSYEPHIYYDSQNSTINIKYNINNCQNKLQVIVYDQNGRKVGLNNVTDDTKGNYSLQFNNSPGVYIVIINAGQKHYSKKLIAF